MNNEELQKRILEKVQDRIAIFEFEKEESRMKKSTKKLANIAATVVITVGLSVGTVYAGGIIYEKIWKEPTRIEASDNEITPEILEKNIQEEDAKKIAQNKLIELGLEDEEIIKTDHYRYSGTEELRYRFITKNWSILINGKTGDFFSLGAQTYDKSVEDYKMTKEEAIKVGKEYYKKLGHQEGEYEFAEIVPVWDDGTDESGCYSARFYKKYGNLYNRGESVCIQFYAKDHKLTNYTVENSKCDNNPIKITKEEAIQIATNEDRKVESNPIIKTTAELKIKGMNGNAYARLHNTQEYYKPLLTIDVPDEERVSYKTENRIRTVWVVVFQYGDEGADIVERVAKGQYSYYVDATTGEIIGGSTSDELHWENYWFERNKVESKS